MESQVANNWHKIRHMLDESKSPYIIIDEPSGLKHHKELDYYVNFINDNPNIWPATINNAEEYIQQLFDKKYPLLKKKKLIALFVLSNSVKCLRALEDFLPISDELAAYTRTAIAYTKVLLECEFTGTNKLCISSPLGGANNKIRYFCELRTQNNSALSNTLKKLLKEEILFACTPANGELEIIRFRTNRIYFLLLVPPINNPYAIIEELIRNYNTCGNLLVEKYILTNTYCPDILQNK